MVAMADIVGANAGRARTHNRQVVLERIRVAGEVGRAEIARGSGLSTQAVSNIIADLLADDLIVETGRRAGTRGLPPVQYGLNPSGAYALGVEIRPDAVFAAVLDLCGTPVASVRRDLTKMDLDGVTSAVQKICAQVTKQAKVDANRCLGAGIVMPGPFGPTGLVGAASDLPIWRDVSPRDWFADALGVPVVVENDANAAAVAERVSGVAKGLETYAVLYFGTGLGLGMVQNGRLVTGAFGNAGEVGHIPVAAGGSVVSLESMVSRLSVQQYLSLSGLDIATVDGLDKAYADRETALMEWLNAAAEPLGSAIAIIENMLDPQTVILGGAMPDAIFDHLIGAVQMPSGTVANRQDRTVPRLMRGASGRMTATLGAAALVINQTFMPQIAAA